MKRTITRRAAHWVPAALIMWGAASSCSRAPEAMETSKLADNAAFDPAPAAGEEASVESMLKRYKGQTKFLNAQQVYSGRRHALESAPNLADAAPAGGARRAVQESDIFKIGKKGSQVLFLLNNYRGLQVVSFEKGANQPELVGRVAATGNMPDTMFYYEEKDKLVVVERVSVDEQGESAWGKEESRILVYDVSNPKEPKITEKVSFKGNVADTRLVGEVLYVAAAYTEGQQSFRPRFGWGMPQQNNGKPKGVVYSFNLTDAISKIDEKELSLPTYRENMNIVEAEVAPGKYKYYLLASLSDSQWGWWDNNSSMIEIVDITNAKGSISPVMVANTKGRILERSATHIKNDTLIAVSNYNSDAGIGRVAVETFKLPTKASQKLSSEEVKFRKMYIERELKKLSDAGASQDEVDAKRKELNNDAELGLAGRFEQTEKGLVKILADSLITVGDSTGQHAALQDVRFVDNLLYAFWVPSNQKDPLEVFDIASPEKGTPYLGRIEFPGWIERSFPISYNNKQYLLGLGLIVPEVDNERQARQPQVRLFEIRRKPNGQVYRDEQDQGVALTLKDKNVWIDLNNQDKYVEMRMIDAEKGIGSLMFRMYRWTSNKSIDGGKVVGFDLSKFPDGEVFTEGGLVTSEWGWLRRVFTNTEIDKINTFTDEQLSVFDTANAGVAEDVFTAIGTVELARNIVGYTSFDKTGVQIVQKGHDYYWWSEGDSKVFTELRQVSSADQEGANNKINVKGSYSDFVKKDGKVYLLTQTNKRTRVARPEGGFDFKNDAKITLTVVKPGEQGLVAEASVEQSLNDESEANANAAFSYFPYYGQGKLVVDADGSMYVSANNKLYLLKETDGLSLTPVLTEGCDMENSYSKSFVIVDKTPFLTWTKLVDESGAVVPPSDNMNWREMQKYYHQNFASKLTAQDSNKAKWSCGASVNIPGTLVGFSNNAFVTDDNRFIDKTTQTRTENDENGKPRDVEYSEVLTRPVLASLSSKENNAALVDLYDYQADGQDVGYRSGSFSSFKRLNTDSYLFIESKQNSEYDKNLVFSSIGFDAERNFVKTSRMVSSDLSGYISLSQIVEGKDGFYALVSNYTQVQLFKVAGFGAKPQALKLKLAGDTEARSTLRLPSVYSLSDDGSKLDFNEAAKTINFAQGLSGVLSASFE